jgi:acyl-CoA synthetase (NDP forming)
LLWRDPSGAVARAGDAGCSVAVRALETGLDRRHEATASLLPFLEPRSVAVIGASDAPGNLGGTAVRLLRKFGYPGAVYPVHPRHREIGGLKAFSAIGDVEDEVELAIVAVAAERVVPLLEECADAGIRHGIVWAGGFAEVGGAGAVRQHELEAVCAARGFFVLGPNCLGVINTSLPLTATFASFLVEAEELVSGDISIVGQSGGLITMAQALAQRRGFGFRYIVSSGNESLVEAADFILAYVDDPGTRVIAAYLEGARDGEKLLEALRAARRAGKPVVVLKGGSTTAAAEAAAAHTAAFAGEARVWNAVLRDHAIPVSSLEELLDVCLQLSGTGGQVLPTGRRAAIVTFGGGSGVLAVDQCVEAGLSVLPLAAATRSKLAPLAPPTASTANPVDLTPVTFNAPEWLAKFPSVLEVLAADEDVDAVLLQCGPMARGATAIVEAIADFAERSTTQVCLAWPLAPAGIPELLRKRRMHVFDEYARAIRTVGKLASYREAEPPPREREADLPVLDWTTIVPGPAPGEIAPEHRCRELLAAAGVPVAAGRLGTSTEEAVRIAKEVGWPVALKAAASGVTHRAAAGLVVLDVGSDDQARRAFGELRARAKERGYALEGIYVQHMEPGVEVLVSAFRDPTFGVVVTCGAGGVVTEALDDVALDLAPVTEERAHRLLLRVRTITGLERADPTLDPGPLAALVSRFSRVAATAPWRRFVIELNPVKWSSEGAVAVDALLVIDEP